MKILIVGLGSIGKRHLHNLAALGHTDLRLLTSQDPANFRQLPHLKFEADLPSALAGRPDVVFVCNPSSLHAETALAAARAGCHVFLEKPVSHNLEGLEELAAIAEVKNLKIQVGFQLRYHPVLQAVKQKIEAGALGRIVAAHAQWGEWLPGWHPWEDYRLGYSARADLGGGVVLTLCHPFDYLRWMLGEATVERAIGGKHPDLETDTEDTALAYLRYESGAIASVWLDYVSRPPRHTLQVLGTEGRAEWDASTGSARVYTNGGSEVEAFFPGRHFERNELFLDEVADFLQCIEQDRVPACTLHDGVRVLEICQQVKSFIGNPAPQRTLAQVGQAVDFG